MQNSLEKIRQLKDGAILLGKFHPTNYIVAVYSSSKLCGKALQSLLEAGWADEDVLVCGGDVMQANRAENILNEGFLNKLLHCFGDPDTFLSAINRLSEEEGYRFLFVYAPSEDLTVRAQHIVASLAVYARKYSLINATDIICQGEIESRNDTQEQSAVDKIGPLFLGNLPVN